MMWGWSHDASMVSWMVAGSVFWGIVVAGAIYLLARVSSRQEPRGRGRQTAGEAPVDVASRRLAAGEISQEEFRRIRDALSR